MLLFSFYKHRAFFRFRLFCADELCQKSHKQSVIWLANNDSCYKLSPYFPQLQIFTDVLPMPRTNGNNPTRMAGLLAETGNQKNLFIS